MIDFIGAAVLQQQSHFSEDAVERSACMVDVNSSIERWNDRDKFQACHEALQQMDFKSDEVEDFFKEREVQYSEGCQKNSDKGKASAMK